jgi:adenylate cyclase
MGKRLLSHFSTALFSSIVMIYLYIHIPESFQSLDNRLRDFMFNIRGPLPTTGNVVIADIDEASLKELGQWPWNRKKMAQIIYNLAAMEVSVVGLDMVFSEDDKQSDSYIIKDRNWSVQGLDEPEDYDEILGYYIANTPTVTGYVFNMEAETPEVEDRPNITANISFKADKQDYIIKPKGILLNVPKIQDNAYSAGFFNNLSDSDGIIRRVPTLMKEDGFYYTSLALEMYRIHKQISTVRLVYDEDTFVGLDMNGSYIPTDKYGRFFVNFRGPAKTFEYISIKDIYNGTVDPAKIKDKLVLIGTSAIGLLDIRTTAFDTAYPGVEVHANVIDNMLEEDFIAISDSSVGYEQLLIIGIIFLVTLIMIFLPATWGMAAILLLSYLLFEHLYYMHFTEHTVINILFPFLALGLASLSSLLLSYIFESRTKKIIREKFSQKVSKDVVDELMKNPDSVVLVGMDKEVTVFFSDVRSFTSISEKLGSAEKLIALMNDYMTPMVDIIIEEKGTIDKFIGDAIMAYWNAPKDLPGHQDYAVRASLRQLAALEPLNVVLKETYDVELGFGIGLNTGVAVVGEMGSHGRSDYTLIGDPVNLGSRVEGLCKPYGVTLIITEFTKAGLKDEYVIRDLDLVQVKGKEQPVAIYEVIDFGVATGELKEELDSYAEALELYRASEFKQALDIFSSLQEKYPKTVYTLYIDRCEHFIDAPPENFDGVFRFTTK